LTTNAAAYYSVNADMLVTVNNYIRE
jgi:hypothetical protein